MLDESKCSVPRVNGGHFPRIGVEPLQAVVEGYIPFPGKETAQEITVCIYLIFKCSGCKSH